MKRSLFILFVILLWTGVVTANRVSIGTSHVRRIAIGASQDSTLGSVKAANPSPADEETDVLLDATFSWDGGGDTYDVYLGTDPGSLVLVSNDQADETYDPGLLDSAQTYYWRVDATDIGGTVTGDVWEFTTATVYSLTITVVGTGDVDQNPGPEVSTDMYYSGTDVTLVAAPDLAYDFDAWSGDLVSSNGTETITMNANKAITATFTIYNGEPGVRLSIGTSLFPRVSIGVAQARPSTWTPPAPSDNASWWWRRRHSD